MWPGTGGSPWTRGVSPGESHRWETPSPHFQEARPASPHLPTPWPYSEEKWEVEPLSTEQSLQSN